MTNDSPETARAGHGLEVAIAVLLAVVAVTAALAAWRTSVVGGSASDENRAGLIAVAEQQALHDLEVSKAYEQASYAKQAAVQDAAAQAMAASGRPALSAASKGITDYVVPGLEQLSGPFSDGSALTASGTFDVPGHIESVEASDAAYLAADPSRAFAKADDYSSEKRWLTTISVLLAISLFWLGLAEITSHRWRLANLVTGVSLWILGIGALLLVEAVFIGGRGGVL